VTISARRPRGAFAGFCRWGGRTARFGQRGKGVTGLVMAEGFNVANALSGQPSEGGGGRTGGYVILVGNEKGGAGKSTVAMHLAVALMAMGKTVGGIDLDVRQRSFTRYVQNRAGWRERSKTDGLRLPQMVRVDPSDLRDLDAAEAEEHARLTGAITRLKASCDYVIIDVPGGNTYLSRTAHQFADTLVTPLNDSFVDFDLLADIDPETMAVKRPSFYSDVVFEARKHRALTKAGAIDWIVMRNRMSPLDARNKLRMTEAIEQLAKRIGFRIAPGLSERVIFRELFPIGLTLLDLTGDTAGITLTMSHVAARQELRDILIVLKLPGLEGAEIRF
jgi:chromosome partitioning protein